MHALGNADNGNKVGHIHPVAYFRFPAGIRVCHLENGRRQMPYVQ
jgi:hypothetical protein